MSYYSLRPLDPFLSSLGREGRREREEGGGERGEGRGEGRGGRGEKGGGKRERGEGRKGEGRREKGGEGGRRERGEGRGEKGEGRREREEGGGAYFYTHAYIDLPYSTLITGCSVIQFLWVYSGPNKIIPRNCCRYYYIHCRYIRH